MGLESSGPVAALRRLWHYWPVPIWTVALAVGLLILNFGGFLLAFWVGGRVNYRFDHPVPGVLAGAAVYAVLAAAQIYALGPANFKCDPPGKYAHCSDVETEWRAR